MDAALTATDHSKGLKLTSRAVFAFQELPRIDPGWRTTPVEERALVQYRSGGVMACVFRLLGMPACAEGLTT